MRIGQSLGSVSGLLALAILAIGASAVLASCATTRGGKYGMARIGAREAEGRLIAVPSTLKVMRDRSIAKAFSSQVALSAARGEAESAQLLYYAGSSAEGGARFVASGLAGPGGARLEPELGVVGYVPLDKPSLYGFHRKGDYPDPVLPTTDFALAPRTNQALWYTVRVPRAAAPGIYSGSVSVVAGNSREWTLPVRLRVYDVELPATSFLKTSINFRRETMRDERYYGPNWTAELDDQLPFLGLSYRFTHRVDLPLTSVFSVREDGSLAADWGDFDERVSQWLESGITCFELKLDIGLHTEIRDIHEKYGRMLEEIDRHLAEKAWTDLFYFYFFDEPTRRDMAALGERVDAVKEHAPSIRHVLTYGVTTAGEKELLGRIGMWVPNMHQFDQAFARERRAQGEEVWAYTCVGNVFRPYPDNFRIDWYGTAHRALGWWLFKYGADGYLYWAVDLWRRNPWETTATFPWTNGDGVLFYPALDGKSAPYPSIRAHLMRDAFEDYDLLTLLGRAYAQVPDRPAEVADLLAAKGVIFGPKAFSKDDEVYARCHERILELLEDYNKRAEADMITAK